MLLRGGQVDAAVAQITSAVTYSETFSAERDLWANCTGVSTDPCRALLLVACVEASRKLKSGA
ncbi:hypothetical protein BH11PLA2_BH11PLA2_41600 [soil metagenome]